MIALRPGRHEATATHPASGAMFTRSITSRVNIPMHGKRQGVMRFDLPAQVAPEMPSPFHGMPFGAPGSG